VVVLVPGDALNDETPVSGGANLFSVGALKAAFYQAARSNILANKPKFLLQIGFVSSDDQSESKFNFRIKFLLLKSMYIDTVNKRLCMCVCMCMDSGSRWDGRSACHPRSSG
jgi:hypothetical protein